MITCIQQGRYKLLETKHQTKILQLDEITFAWINAQEIGEILVATHRPFKTDAILSVGNFRLYEVEQEKDLTDTLHLELHAGNGTWQGYLLPTGLPSEDKKRNRIIPTSETITHVL
ncbi:MAG TPA: hypothetical protein VG935_04475 [Patescibacteria group bacterium]|nr:hypothetical protein [Patescibacteria group bacterium]